MADISKIKLPGNDTVYNIKDEVARQGNTNQKVKTSTVTFGNNDEIQITAGSNITVTGDSSAKTITIAASQPTVNNGKLTIQKNGEQVQTFTANQSGNVTANIEVPTKTSDLENDSDFVVDASYVHTDNNFTTTYKEAVDANSQKVSNVQADWNATTGLSVIKNKPTLGTAASKNTGTGSGNVPVLGSDGKLASSVLPAIAVTDTFVVNSQSAMLALTAQVGDVAVRTDQNKSYILKTAGASTLANWQELLTPTDAVISVNSKTGAVQLGASDVGALPDTTTYLASASKSGNTLTITPSSGTALTYTPTFTDTNQKIKAGTVTFGNNDEVNIVAGSNVTVTGDATNKKITIAASYTDTNYYQTPDFSTGLKIATGTGVSDLYVPTGNTSSTVCIGNDSRLSDSRTPKSHTHGNITNTGTITSAAVATATGVLVYDSSNKIQRATAADTRAIIGAGTSNFSGSYNDLTDKPTIPTDTGATSIETTGTGNAVTAASYSATTRKITLTKGTTFLTAHQTIPVTDVQVDGSSVLDGTVAKITMPTELKNPNKLNIKVNSETSNFIEYDGSAVKTVTVKPSSTNGAFIINDGTTDKTIQLAGTFTDTKNTSGTTNKTGTKMFIVGATSQAANPQTYSNSNVYIGTDNCLYSNGAKVLTSDSNDNQTVKVGTTEFGANDVVSFVAGTNVTVVGDSSAKTITINATQPDVSNFIEKSSTSGLVKNDGTIDTTSYRSNTISTNSGKRYLLGSSSTTNMSTTNTNSSCYMQSGILYSNGTEVVTSSFSKAVTLSGSTTLSDTTFNGNLTFGASCNVSTETWTFTLSDGTSTTKTILLFDTSSN